MIHDKGTEHVIPGDPLRSVLIPINREGWPFILLFAVISLGLGLIAAPLGWLGAILTLWCVYFFRDPERVTPIRDGLIISPADGVVQLIDVATPPPELEVGDSPRPRVCIFMNVFNVHVNRAPAGGVITKIAYRPGKFLNASFDKASVDNERQSLAMRTDDGADIIFVQIAGLVARRIVCQVEEGQSIKAGQRFGLIRFGSRVDVYLPEGTSPMVCPGQIAVAGETIIADLTTSEAPREGDVR
ncbi:phosphatidylserine decarboxylase [Varunaivibrio sulfuroxidans]|uniref:phosphatidylserine decarboxylase n=1 Tax=Varunaivibrio sulfuroxidans TaxID=1773489 RepID=UPI00104B3571|nr:phosphatidylserine decarboxylase [Varunaivibrio sulfuroxidans]WES31981.1 phosphatidylserine decarboxylase [Varunaivibrio sulfuroxidans]